MKKVEVSEVFRCIKLFHDGGRYHIETSPSICRVNQWNCFYMITASVMKELKAQCSLTVNGLVVRLWVFKANVGCSRTPTLREKCPNME